MTAKKTSVSLGSAVDIAHVEELKIRLENALTKEPTVVIKASKVERADSAGLQLLYAFIQKAKSQQVTVNWNKPSDSLRKAGKRLGLLENLGL